MSDERELPPGELEEKRVNCEPCPECNGSGYGVIIDDDKENPVTYVACDFCGGYQCFLKDGADWYFGPCPETCGINRESYKKDYPNI